MSHNPPGPQEHGMKKLAAPETHTIQDLEVMAKRVAQSKLFGLDEAQTFTLMLLAQADGIHPIHALRRYHVVKGRPAMKSEAMLADMMKRGWLVKWNTSPTDNKTQSATFSHPTKCAAGQTMSFGVEEAKQAGLFGSETYQKYPCNMFRARMISNACRMLDPDVVAGVYTPEEAEDMLPVVATARIPPEPRRAEATHQGNGTKARSEDIPDPEMVREFVDWITRYCDSINSKWLNEITDKHGEITSAPDAVVNRFQLAKHLIKWGNLEYALNMPYPPPDDLRDRYATIVWARDREAAARESRSRCKVYWREAKDKLKPAHKPLPHDDDRDVPDPDEPRRDREPGDDDQ